MARTPRPDRPPAVRAQRPSALRPGTRLGGPGRRVRPVRRASAGLNPTRAGALLGTLVAAAGIYGLIASDLFVARDVVVEGAEWTSAAEVRAAADVDDGLNLFTLQTGPVRERVEELVPVLRAEVAVGLPGTVRVAIVERRPLLVWAAGDRRFLVDEEGLLFLELGADTPADAARLPVVEDARASSGAMAVGKRLDLVDLDASLRLGSLRPNDVGSTAGRILLRVDDAEGYTVGTGDDGWTAVFGFYTPTLRTTELIPGQVRLLRSLLEGREAEVQKVVLADDRNGTYIPRPSASAAP